MLIYCWLYGKSDFWSDYDEISRQNRDIRDNIWREIIRVFWILVSHNSCTLSNP